MGGNGTGKSTLLKVIAGLETLDYGSTPSMKGIRLGYLPQDGLQRQRTQCLRRMYEVFADVKELEEELEEPDRTHERAGSGE